MFQVPWLRVSGKLTALEYCDKMIELNTIIPNAYSTMISIDEFDTHYNDCEGAGICDQFYYLEFEAEC